MQVDSIFKESLQQFLDRCSAIGLDVSRIEQISRAAIARLTGRPGGEPHEVLEQSWYSSLDFAIYTGDEYLGDIWSCWREYSRKYLLNIQKKPYLCPASVVDLGCGLGYTTAALREMYPTAEVFGTNLSGTSQTRFASALASERGFLVIETAKDVGATVDLVFASEYFEHFEQPIPHLDEILSTLAPKDFVIANAFGAKAIGHFEEYIVNGEKTSGKRTSLAFNKCMRAAGYHKAPTGFWNNRFSIWRSENGRE